MDRDLRCELVPQGQVYELCWQLAGQVRASGYRPQVVCMYLYDLTKAFNRMYKHCPVLRAEPALRQARAELVEATGVLIRDALGLIGIEAVDRM